jgi:hypothetical protein
MSLINVLAYFRRGQRPEASFLKFVSSQPDQDLGRGLEAATQVQATLEQMVQHLSVRYEPDRLACRRANLKRVRHYIHLATLECAARKAGLGSAAEQPCRTMARNGFFRSALQQKFAPLISARQSATYP